MKFRTWTAGLLSLAMIAGCSGFNPRVLTPNTPNKAIRTVDAGLEVAATTIDDLIRNGDIDQKLGNQLHSALTGIDLVQDAAVAAIGTGDQDTYQRLQTAAEKLLEALEQQLAALADGREALAPAYPWGIRQRAIPARMTPGWWTAG